jgi:hypothetical protein
VFITHYCILLADASVVASVLYPRQEVLSAISKRDVDHVEALTHPLQGNLFGEVVRISCYDDMDDLGFVKRLEEGFVL